MTRQQEADRFGVSLSFVAKRWRRQRAGAKLAPKPASGGRPCCLNASAQALLVAEHGQTGCLGVVWRVLNETDLRRKKSPPCRRA